MKRLIVGIICLNVLYCWVPSYLLPFRLPQAIGAILCGMAFGLAGYLFQTLLDNPLASPDVLGVSAGCSLAAVICLLFLGFGPMLTGWVACLAGLSVSGLIFWLSNRHGYSKLTMILIGIGSQAMMSAGISIALLKANTYQLKDALRWLNGSLNEADWPGLMVLGMILVIAFGLIIVFYESIGLYKLGDELAQSLGLDVKKLRTVFFVVSLCLVGFACSVCGPMASLSFICGPIVTRWLKKENPIFEAGLMGALILSAANFNPFPAGILTGLIGAPVLLYVLYQMKGNL